ncbi:hypothetical protein [Oceanivirga miroungae]|uniref:Uncharacterized protein n=1 Tax=Oceanivirga miroungae TaxID=1130046 RepID=A0A6I8M7C6_9FUSO|nr:hypothetical protein [Oceanivirga miroungae]VWL85784.1 hypothetical protein OMES3154_01073 [Oceanivirga miroungae]
MKKTMISVLALCSTIALANAELGINGDTKTGNFKDFEGKVEVFGKYNDDVVDAEVRSHLVNYKDSKVTDVITGDYLGKLEVKALRSDLHDVTLGAIITKAGGDDYKIDKKNDHARAYVTYKNRMVKDLELSSTTAISAKIKADDSNYFGDYEVSQKVGETYKLGDYTNEGSVEYVYGNEFLSKPEEDFKKAVQEASSGIDKNNAKRKEDQLVDATADKQPVSHKLIISDKNSYVFKGIDLYATPSVEISFKGGKKVVKVLDEAKKDAPKEEDRYKYETKDKVYRHYTPKLELGASAKVKGVDLKSKLYTEFDIEEVRAKDFGNKSGLEVEAKATFGDVTVTPKFSTEFELIRNKALVQKTDEKDAEKEALVLADNNKSLDEIFFNKLDKIFFNKGNKKELKGFTNATKLSVETAYKNDKLEVKVTPSVNLNLEYLKGIKAMEEKSVAEEGKTKKYIKTPEFPSLIETNITKTKKDGETLVIPGLVDAKLEADVKYMFKPYLDLMAKDTFNYGYFHLEGYRFDDENKSIKKEPLAKIMTVSNELTLSADLHKDIEGFKVSVMPSLALNVKQAWEQEAKLNSNGKTEYKYEQIDETPDFLSVKPGIEAKFEKEISEGLVFNLGAGLSNNFSYAYVAKKDKDGKVISRKLETKLSDDNSDVTDYATLFQTKIEKVSIAGFKFGKFEHSTFEAKANFGLTYKF